MKKQEKEIRNVRLQKLENFKKKDINPYPAKSKRDVTCKEASLRFDEMKDKDIILTGRILSLRPHGGSTFANIYDGTDKFQLFFKRDILGDEKYRFLKNYDIGDFIQVSGKLFKTKKEERTLEVSDFNILTKSIKPLPDKWHGIKDEETRYRKRYLDILMNPELKEMFQRKSCFWNSMRSYLIDKGFMEVETPVLEATPGGADAEPFVTHHNALDIDLYLRISMGELWQKRLMVAGFNKTFEIGRQFRNEGIDAEHLQDYTQMEFYMAYSNYEDGMRVVEDMYKNVIQKTFGKLDFKIREFDINFDKKWDKIDFVQAIKEELEINVLESTEEEIKKKCEELDLETDKKMGKGRLMDTLWKSVRKKIAGPAFLINHPVAVSPLAKRKKDNPELVERFQVIIAGSEIGNGYSELNDPLDQTERFQEQAKLREEGDSEAQMHDKEFVEALEYGMPPTCGFGVSERLFSFLMDKPIRECVLFPLLRPKDGGNNNLVQDNKKVDFNISREKSLELLKEHVKEEPNIFHNIETEAIMRALADKLGENEELWGATGLLHDLDWEETGDNNMKEHGLKTEKYLKEKDYPEKLIKAIKAHNYKYNKTEEPRTKLDYALRCGETITGLIYASALVRPDKKLESVKVKSINKKMKDKSFASKVDREVIKECEKLGLELKDFIEISLGAMKKISKEIGL